MPKTIEIKVSVLLGRDHPPGTKPPPQVTVYRDEVIAALIDQIALSFNQSQYAFGPDSDQTYSLQELSIEDMQKTQ